MENQVLPPCQAACPIHQDAKGYINHIAKGEFSRAFEVIMDTNPLAASCGAICAHHCEEKCRRNEIDDPLSIRGLKDFAVKWGKEAKITSIKPSLEAKIAIVGSGPAGLAAAQTLARIGYGVTVFEKEEKFGGALQNYIPLYRLPAEAINKDISNLAELGVNFKFNSELGNNLSFDDLKKEYNAIILSLGLCKSRGLNIPEAEHPNNYLALPFLKKVKHEGLKLSGENVIVIGGGNVAMDVARSALRAGAATVKAACLESRDEMPAFSWEIEEAEEEGVEFFCSAGPEAVLTEGDKVKGLKVKKVKSVFDKEGRFNPVFYDEVFTIDGDMVIFSIGQGSDLNCIESLDITSNNRLCYNAEDMSTSLDGVFACGEVVTGAGTAVQAMSNGRKTAFAVDSYLQKKEFIPAVFAEDQVLPQIVKEITDKVKPTKRETIPLVEAEKRVNNFDPVETGFSLVQALQESRRCMNCGSGAKQVLANCAHCLTCLRTCPYDVPTVNSDGVVELREEFCQSCGLCLSNCPARTINFKSPDITEGEESMEGALIGDNGNAKEETLLVITCSYIPFAMDWYNKEFFVNKPANIKIVKFPCTAKIDSLHMLKAFDNGASAVLIAGCTKDDKLVCRYYDTTAWTEKRIIRTRETLSAVGISPENLQLSVIPPLDNSAFAAVVDEFYNKALG